MKSHCDRQTSATKELWMPAGTVCNKIPVSKQLAWDVFIAVYDILIANDGELYKGYARTGKLGSDRLPIASLEGYISYAVHVEKGESALSLGFAIAAILGWSNKKRAQLNTANCKQFYNSQNLRRHFEKRDHF